MSQIINNTALTKWRIMTTEKKIENQKNQLKKLISEFYVLVEKAVNRDPSCFYPREISNKKFLTISDVYESVDDFVFGILFASETFISSNEMKNKYLINTVSNIKSYMRENGSNTDSSEEQLYERHIQIIRKKEVPEIIYMLVEYEKKNHECSMKTFMYNLEKNYHAMSLLRKRINNGNFLR